MYPQRSVTTVEAGQVDKLGTISTQSRDTKQVYLVPLENQEHPCCMRAKKTVPVYLGDLNHYQGRLDPFYYDELTQIVASMTRPWDIATRVMIETGITLAELCALKKTDFDTGKGQVIIHQCVNDAGKVVPCKSRTVPLSIMLAKSVHNSPNPEPSAKFWLPGAKANAAVKPDTFIELHWRPALEKLGIRYRHPDSIRQSRILELLCKGHTIDTVCKLLGIQDEDDIRVKYTSRAVARFQEMTDTIQEK
jgi:integrase